MTISREQFFRDTLIPTGTLVELLMLAAADRGLNKKYGGRLGTLLWEPLNLLSCYLLAKQEPSPTTLEVLQTQVLHISTHVREWLKEMATRRVSAFDFAHGQFASGKIQELLAPSINRIYAELLYDTRYPNKWFAENQSSMYTIGTRDSLGAWRTFARNLEPERTVTTMKLPAVYQAAAKRLTSKQGVARVMTLWYQCFPVDRNQGTPKAPAVKVTASPAPATSSVANAPVAAATQQVSSAAEAKTAASPNEAIWSEETLPTFVNVSSGPSGVLEVSAMFDPGLHVKLKSEVKKPLPVAMRKRLVKRNKVITCPYRDLAQAVDEITLWYRAECLEAAKLDQEYTTWAESFLSKDLLERLRKNFTETEIPLLLREMAREQETKSSD